MSSNCGRSALILVCLVMLGQPHSSLGTSCNQLPADHRVNQRRFHCCSDTDEELISCLLLCGPAGSKEIEFICNLTAREWNHAFDPYDFHCGDHVVPEFPDGCPANLEAVIHMSVEESVSVTYDLPRAIGSSGGYVQVLGSPAPGSVFKLGTTNVTVTAKDGLNQLTQTCTFAIRVKRLSCDFHELNKAKLIYVKRDDGYQANDYYKLSCPSGYELHGDPLAVCELNIFTLTKNWIQPLPFCHNCLRPRKPNKGDVVCGAMGHGGIVCTLNCDATLIQPAAIHLLTCLNGEWDPFNFFSDCIERHKPSGILIEAIVYTRVPECNVEKLSEARLKLSASLPSTDLSAACNDTPCVATLRSLECYVNTITEVYIQYNLHVMVKTFKQYTDEDAQIDAFYALSAYFCSYIRDRPATIKLPVFSATEHDLGFEINCDVDITCSVPGTVAQFSSVACVGCGPGHVYDNITNCNQCPPNTYQDQDIGLACTPCPGTTVTINSASVSPSDCKAGCGRGMWLNAAQKLCLPCPRGTYQDQDVATSCKPCPAPATTLAEKGVSVLDCVELCPPGQWSRDGAKPCQPCPVGTYQPEGGTTQCVVCSFGMSTLAPGQSSIHGCVYFDVRLSDLGPAPVIRNLEILPVRFTWMVWLAHVWSYHTDTFKFSLSAAPVHPNPGDAYITIDKFVLTLWTGQLAPVVRKWNHVAIIYDLNVATLYVNGQFETTATLQQESFGILNYKKILFKGSDSIKSIWASGMQMTSKVLTQQELANFVSSCEKTLDENVLTSGSVTVLTSRSCTATNWCANNPCGPNRICYSDNEGYVCKCEAPRTGPECDLPNPINHLCVQAVTYVWGGWGQWSAECRRCGSCTRKRTRRCVSFGPPEVCAPPGGGPVEGSVGEDTYYMDCNKDLLVASTWGVWSEWSACSDPCPGFKVRSRVCDNPRPEYYGTLCAGQSYEILRCESTCPERPRVDGTWTEWYNWTGCSVTCGPGTMLWRRECVGAKEGRGLHCEGAGHKAVACTDAECRKVISWEPWLQWAECKIMNRLLQRERIRNCSAPYPLVDEACIGSPDMWETCQVTKFNWLFPMLGALLLVLVQLAVFLFYVTCRPKEPAKKMVVDNQAPAQTTSTNNTTNTSNTEVTPEIQEEPDQSSAV